MNKLNIQKVFLFGIFLLLGLSSVQAQSDKELLRELIAEEQEAVDALVLYPEETRLAIFNATSCPEALIKMESIQTQTSTAFKKMMESYPQDIQEMIWDLTRYPALVHRLAAIDVDSEDPLKTILKNYPEVIHPKTKQAVRDYHPVLIEIDQLNQAAASAFEFILDDYPPQSKEALQHLITLPEVLTILTENIRLTILVGDLYQKAPQWLRQKADSLNLVVARRNAKELEDWKANLENNQEAIEELKASGAAYSEDYAYDDAAYDDQKYIDDLYYEEEEDRPDEMIIEHHYSYHYPYWFGYPSWYEYPRWRNYPYWYDWGFYISPQRTIVVFGLPSYHFTHWYFYHPHHHTHWPHLSTHFVNHYYGHRKFGSSSVTTSVKRWRSQNAAIITDKWLENDGQMPDRFKTYGKFETERTKFNQKNPRKAVSQKEYAEQHKKRYPKLSKATKQPKDVNVVRKKKEANRSVKPKAKKPAIERSKVTKPKVEKKPPKKAKKPTRKKPLTPKVNRAKDYHKDTWEKSKNKKRVIPKSKRIKKMPKSKKSPKAPNKIKRQKKSKG